MIFNKQKTININLKSADVKFVLLILVILLLTFSKSFAQTTRTSTGSANWNTAGTWNPTGVPAIGDDVIIREQDQVTVNTNAVCNTLTINGGSTTTNNITISSGFSLNVTGLISIGVVTNSLRTKTIAVGAESLTCGSLTLANNSTGSFSRITISTGKFTINGDITMNGSNASENLIVFSGAGTLLIAGNWSSSTNTVTLATNCKVIYNGSTAQNVRAGTYRKLQFYGAGAKSLRGNTTVGGSAGDSLDISEEATIITTTRTISAGTTGIVFQVNGKITTTNTSGLFGATGRTFLATNSPTINIGSNSTIEYASTSAQEVTAANYATLITTGASTKTISATTTVSNELIVNTGSTLATGGFLTLTSTSTKTARLGIATGTITGNVTVQRFIPGGADKRKWRFLSSPVNVSGSIALSQLIDNILITAPAGAAAGFDVNTLNPANTASLRTYTESVSGSSLNGWTDPTDTSNTITTGKGMEVFVRGTRGLTNPYLNWTSPDNVTIDYVGALNTGSISPAITYTPSVGGATTADGFNLVGNPYASAINFDTTGWILTNIDNKFWCYNPNTGSYGIYDAALNTGTNSITKYIASGQAFFVRANAASPVLTFAEATKVEVQGNNYFKGNANQSNYPILRINISNDSTYSDEAIVVLDENASCRAGDLHDAGKLFNDALNVYTVSDDYVNLTINALPCSKNVDTINVSVFSYNGANIMTTPHHFEFSGMSNFSSSKYIYLKDEYTNTLTNLNTTSAYDFNITADAASWGNKRFKLLFANSSLGLNVSQVSTTIELFPNPASSEINLKFNSNTNDGILNYQIIDLLGKVILEGTTDVQNLVAKINIESVPNGQFILRSTTNSSTNTIRFVK
jgi:hypothetical protein